MQDQLTVASAASTAPVAPACRPGCAHVHASRAQMQAGLDEVLRGEHIAFESNSAVLTPKGRAVIDKGDSGPQTIPRSVIEIGGHTDSMAIPDYNLQLSRTRMNPSANIWPTMA